MMTASEKRYYSVRVAQAYAAFIQKRYAEVKVDEVFRYAEISPSELLDLSHMLTQRQVNRLYEKAVQLTGNLNLARDAGRYIAASSTVGATRSMTLAMLGPGAAYTLIGFLTRRFSSAVNVVPHRLGKRKFEMVFTPLPEVKMEPFQCENTKGGLEAISLIFDVPVRLEHPECLFSGGKCCRYVLEWESVPSETALYWRNILAGVLGTGVALSTFFLGAYAVGLAALASALLVAILTARAYRLMTFESRAIFEKIRADTGAAIESAQAQYNNALIVNHVGNALSRQVGRFVEEGLSTDAQIDALLSETLGVLKTHLGFDRAVFFLKSDSGELAVRVAKGFTAEDEKRVKARAISLAEEHTADDPLVRCYRKRETVVGGGSAESTGSGWPAEWGCRHFAACPLVYEDEVIGVLLIDNTSTGKALLAGNISLLTGIAPAVAISIRNVRLAEKAAALGKLEVEQAALKKDLEVTRAVQTLLLPKNSSIRMEGFALDSFYEPAAQSGGDWWWHERLSDGRHRVVVGDVTGHGVGSAMVTAILAGAYRAARAARQRDLEIEELLPLLNETLRQLCAEVYWVAFMAVDFDLSRDRVRIGGAGIPPLFLENVEGEIKSCSSSVGNLGIENLTFEIEEHRFGPGDSLFLCTDGSYEFKTASGASFGRRRLQQALGSTRGMEPSARLSTLVNALKAARQDPKQFEDDVTLIHVERPLG